MRSGPVRSPGGPPAVSAVIAAKEEEPTVGETIELVKPYVDEIILVDGHSRDRTREIAVRLGATVELDSGRGKGDAIRVGLRRSRGEIVVFLDADGSHDPREIPALVAPILAGEADLVVGCRIMGGSDELHGTLANFVRLAGGLLINLAINYRWGVRLTDVQNGFRAIDRRVALALDLTETKHTIEQEMTMKCLKRGYRVKNVPSHEFARRFGEPRLRLGRQWPLFLWCLVRNLV